MPHPLHGLTWEERFETPQAWTCRFHAEIDFSGTLINTFLGAPIMVLLALLGGASSGGGVVPTLGALLMTSPVFLWGFLLLRASLEPPEVHRIALDRGGLVYTYPGCAPVTVATSEIADLVEQSWGVEIRDGEGRCLRNVYTRSGPFVARRLRAALAHVREPRSYRD